MQQATYIVSVNPESFFPSKTADRVEWIERFGVPKPGSCEVTASLRDWASVGANIRQDGSLDLSEQRAIREQMFAAVVAIARDTGEVPSQLPEPMRQAVFAARVDEIARQKAKDEAERIEQEKRLAENAAMIARIVALPPSEVAKRLGEDTYPAVAQATVVEILGETIERGRELWNKAMYEWADEVLRLYRSEIEAAFERLVLSVLTPEQTERFRARVLPVAERDRAVRERLFAPFAEFARYRAIDKSNLVHADACDEYEVRFVVRDVHEPEMSAEMYAVYKRILVVADACAGRGRGPEGQDLVVEHQVRSHESSCDCNGPGHSKLGLRVTMSVCGHSYSAEFELQEPVAGR